MVLLAAFIKTEYKFKNKFYSNKDKLFCNLFLEQNIAILNPALPKIQIQSYGRRINQKKKKFIKINLNPFL